MTLKHIIMGLFIVCMLPFTLAFEEVPKVPQGAYKVHHKTHRHKKHVVESPKNPYKEINDYIETLDTPFPKELVKAIAWGESEWKQFNKADSLTGDWGVMQINEKTIALYHGKNQAFRIKNDTKYNIKFGVKILQDKYKYVLALKHQKNWAQLEKTYRLKNMETLDMTILAYNGFRSNHCYVRYIKKIMEEKPWEAKVNKA